MVRFVLDSDKNDYILPERLGYTTACKKYKKDERISNSASTSNYTEKQKPKLENAACNTGAVAPVLWPDYAPFHDIVAHNDVCLSENAPANKANPFNLKAPNKDYTLPTKGTNIKVIGGIKDGNACKEDIVFASLLVSEVASKVYKAVYDKAANGEGNVLDTMVNVITEIFSRFQPDVIVKFLPSAEEIARKAALQALKDVFPGKYQPYYDTAWETLNNTAHAGTTDHDTLYNTALNALPPPVNDADRELQKFAVDDAFHKLVGEYYQEYDLAGKHFVNSMWENIVAFVSSNAPDSNYESPFDGVTPHEYLSRTWPLITEKINPKFKYEPYTIPYGDTPTTAGLALSAGHTMFMVEMLVNTVFLRDAETFVYRI